MATISRPRHLRDWPPQVEIMENFRVASTLCRDCDSRGTMTVITERQPRPMKWTRQTGWMRRCADCAAALLLQ